MIGIWIWLTSYLALFTFLLYQEFSLNRRLSSPAWKWEIAAFATSFGSIIARILLYISPHFDGITVLQYIISLVPPMLTLLFFIRSRYLLNNDLSKMFHEKRGLTICGKLKLCLKQTKAIFIRILSRKRSNEVKQLNND